MPMELEPPMVPRFEVRWSYDSTTIAPCYAAPTRAYCPPRGEAAAALPRGLAVAVRAGPDNTEDGDGEQGSQGHVGADEGGGHDSQGRGGGMGQRGEEGDERFGESREHEGGEAERPDAGAGLRVGHASPPALLAHLSALLVMSCVIPCPSSAVSRAPKGNAMSCGDTDSTIA